MIKLIFNKKAPLKNMRSKLLKKPFRKKIFIFIMKIKVL